MDRVDRAPVGLSDPGRDRDLFDLLYQVFVLWIMERGGSYMIRDNICCRCRVPIPYNHLEFRAKKADKPDGLYPICSDCAGIWRDEIANHFKKWIKEGVNNE